MNLPEAVFKIVEDHNCPMYSREDVFELSDITLKVPKDHPTCLILAMDIAEIMLDIAKERDDEILTTAVGTFECSSCTGIICLEYQEKSDHPVEIEQIEKEKPGDTDTIARLLKGFSFFNSLTEEEIQMFVPLLKIHKYNKDEHVINQGDPGKHLYIILNGKVEVVGNDDISIAFLGKGEVFGEMSLLSGDPIGADIKVVEPTTLFYINSKNFRRILVKVPSLHMYFAQMLTKRLTKANVEMTEELASAMAGNLIDMQPAELMQALNQNQKTGVLTLQLKSGEAEIFFNEGSLIRARYNGLIDKEAFFSIIAENEGRFKFIPGLVPEDTDSEEIGDFMWLLMEGMNRLDER